jgi:(p)ppGpp synthase/HD superfamily hydrolase
MKEVELKIKIDWCIEQHHQTNHFYDEYLPYEFHLRMVAQAAKDFERLLTPGSYYHHTIILACYGHDLIEDTRVSYNDVKAILGVEAADIVYAVSNEKGKNRKERANDKYYEGIRNTAGAVFVKLCDRIANVQYSKMTKSRMFEMYKKENEEFGKQLGVWQVPGYSQHEFFPLFAYLLDLFEEK